MAQSVERILGKDEVASSILASSFFLCDFTTAAACTAAVILCFQLLYQRDFDIPRGGRDFTFPARDCIRYADFTG